MSFEFKLWGIFVLSLLAISGLLWWRTENPTWAGDDEAVTLENDSFIDKAIAAVHICLWDRPGGGMTSAAQLLVRPLDIRGDESGEHPGESFVMVTITREEMRAILAALDDD